MVKQSAPEQWLIQAPLYPGALMVSLMAQRGHRIRWLITPTQSAPLLAIDHQVYRHCGLRPPQWPFEWITTMLNQLTKNNGIQRISGILISPQNLVEALMKQMQSLEVEVLAETSQPPDLQVVYDSLPGTVFYLGYLKEEAGVPGLLIDAPPITRTYMGDGLHYLSFTGYSLPPQHAHIHWSSPHHISHLSWRNTPIPTLVWPHYPLGTAAMQAEAKALITLRRLIALLSDLPPTENWKDLIQSYQQQICSF